MSDEKWVLKYSTRFLQDLALPINDSTLDKVKTIYERLGKYDLRVIRLGYALHTSTFTVDLNEEHLLKIAEWILKTFDKSQDSDDWIKISVKSVMIRISKCAKQLNKKVLR